MKIAQVISTPPFAWATGGCARIAHELSKELANKGHEVTIITTDLYKPDQRYINTKNPEYIDGIRFFRFRCASNWLAWKHKLYISPKLLRYLKINLQEYEVVHLQDLISIQAIITSKYCKKYKIPYILTAHGSIPWLYKKSILSWVFNRLWGHNILTNADKITVFTEEEAEQCRYMKVSEDKIKLIPNGIDLNKYKNLPEKMEFRNKYTINKNKKIILYIGRIEQSKGIDLLIESFSLLAPEMDDVLLLITGPDDGYLNTLNKLVLASGIEDKVIFTGFLEEKDKIRAYVDADVHVSPRQWEPFGLTLLESCACGTPVICSKGCGIANVIDNQVGIAVPYNKYDMKTALMRVLKDDETKRKFGENGKLIVQEQFSFEKIVEEVEKTYKEFKR
ncbi:hypothetical protein LI82_10130 [Methanococcoides methylutens]|uniref:Glycosyl transferase family 1 n=1 Tax=Methanococcoides methylutens TaxID=2226 RepID=A0A099SYY1_METMT|nr:glycosyltransferase [Methanococcoides methylutens]KGK98087.1 hypothetical protein LI82_10130 [Methanococcoides methylutens]